jgi:Protein of unknown function (DUF3306)
MSQAEMNHSAINFKGSASFLVTLCIAWLVMFAPVAVAQDREKGTDASRLAAASDAPDVTVAAFDLAALPPLDSIDAHTNIAVFLQNGVPAEMRIAALRRAWTMDPAIRTFREVAESDWDFDDLNSIPGFGEFVPEADAQRMLAQIFGDTPRLAARTPTRSDELYVASFLKTLQRRVFDVVAN